MKLSSLENTALIVEKFSLGSPNHLNVHLATVISTEAVSETTMPPVPAIRPVTLNLGLHHLRDLTKG